MTPHDVIAASCNSQRLRTTSEHPNPTDIMLELIPEQCVEYKLWEGTTQPAVPSQRASNDECILRVCERRVPEQ